MTKMHIIIPALALLFLATSCGKDENDVYSQQEKNIESIVNSLTESNTEATVDYLDGPVRVTVSSGEGEALKNGGTVTFKYAGYRISGSSLSSGNLFITNDKDFAESSNWTVTDSTVFKTDTFVFNEFREGVENRNGRSQGRRRMLRPVQRKVRIRQTHDRHSARKLGFGLSFVDKQRLELMRKKIKKL